MSSAQELLTRREALQRFVNVGKVAVAMPILVATACEVDAGLRWESYRSSVLPFEGEYPSGWYIQHNQSSEQFRETTDGSKFSTNILVVAEAVSPSIKLPEYQRRIENLMLEDIKKKGGVKGLQGDTMKINGIDAAVAKGTMPAERPPLYVNGFPEYDFRTAIFVANGSGWVIVASFLPSDVKKGEAIFTRFGSKFRFK